MSAVANNRQLLIALDHSPVSLGRTDFPGVLRSFVFQRHLTTQTLPGIRSQAHSHTSLWPGNIRKRHANVWPLRVLARDATQGASVANNTLPTQGEGEIIVLGLSPEAALTATPISGAPSISPAQLSPDMVNTCCNDPGKAYGDQEAKHVADPATETSTPTEGPTAQSEPLSAYSTSSSQPDGLPNSSATAAPDEGPSAINSPEPQPSSTPPLSSSGDAAREAHQGTTESPGLWARFVAAVQSIQWVKMWALTLLSVSYVHQATTGFALPAMLPMISAELHLTDIQGALLTTGYSYLYAVALVPIGLLADRVSRPKLLAGGLALWSILTATASTCRSFGDLMLARVGFAAAQGAQNPVCFSLIPELFPVNKSTALSLYNCAIYVGRALSFAAVLLARHLHDNDQAHLAARGGLRMETRLDHLDRADLHSLSIMHTAGEMAAATPDHEFIFSPWEYGNELPDAAWRQVLRWIAIPGFLIGLAMMTTLQEPREAALQSPQHPAPTTTTVVNKVLAPEVGPHPTTVGALPSVAAPPLVASTTATATGDVVSSKSQQGDATTAPGVPVSSTPVGAEANAKTAEDANSQSRAGITALLRSPGFMSVTLAAALNDVGSYALIAWQSTFYERVYGLEPSSYAPVLAALLPLSGILGGVGGGYLADRLGRFGQRWVVTAGGTLAAAPCLALSCLAPAPELSYAALMVGFALSEMWRAPSAVMARGIAPASMGSTASALYLCIRNLLGGLGPLAVAGLIGVCGLQQAMLVVPAMYAASGLIFAKAEKLYDAEMALKEKAA